MCGQMKETEQRLHEAIKGASTTKRVIIGPDALAQTPACFAECFGNRPSVVIADRNTYRAAGQAVVDAFAAGGFRTRELLVIEDDDLHAEYRFVEMLTEFLSGTDAIPVAVGSGTINDLVKLASHQCGKPYMVVATAASMDGYAAFGASITKDNYKQTIFCPAPVALIADIGVLEDAPEGMNASGYSDLIAKIPAGADWIVADALGIEPMHEAAWSLVQPNLRKWVGNPEGIRNNDRDALIMLMEGLIMSGLAMQVAQSSRPASGADHLFSHLWDNEHHVHNGVVPSHGIKVGIGSICSEALYEYILSLNADDIRYDADSISRRWPTWSDVEAQVAEHFRDPQLAEQATAQCKGKYINADALSARLKRLHSMWEDLRVRLRGQLLGAGAIQDMISRAGAASLPTEIGIGYTRLHDSFRPAQLLRQRYTVLDLALEMGVWDESVGSLFGPNGFWSNAQDEDCDRL